MHETGRKPFNSLNAEMMKFRRKSNLICQRGAKGPGGTEVEGTGREESEPAEKLWWQGLLLLLLLVYFIVGGTDSRRGEGALL